MRERLSISHEGGAKIPYHIRTRAPETYIVELETEEVARGDGDQHIHMKIDKGFKPIDGHLGLKKAHITPIVLKRHDDLLITRISPRRSGDGRYIEVQVSSSVDIKDAKPYIVMEPEIDFRLASRYRYLRILGDFKPADRYTVTVKQGLRSEDNAVLRKEFSTTVTMPNLNPNLRFIGEGRYLPRDGELNLGLATININKVQVEIEKVFANNLVHLASAQGWSDYAQNLGESVHREEVEIQSVLNDEVTTPIPLKDYLSADHIGIFKVTARDIDRRWRRATQWVMLTDLGIMAKKSADVLWVWVNSLSSLRPVPNAKIELMSHNNQTLLSGTTDENGWVKFTSIAEKIKDFTPFMVTAAKGSDLAFIQLNQHKLPTTDFDVTGAPYLNRGYEAFIYPDRGVYRPGEVANVVGIVRAANRATPPRFPVMMRVLGPNRRIMREFRAQTDVEGACEFQIALPPYVKTGRYTAKLIVAEQEIGRSHFQVEEFVPDRIKVKLNTDKPVYSLGDEAKISVAAVNLFGPPAVGRRVQAACDIEADIFAPAEWRSFTFNDAEIGFQKQRIDLGETRTDENGQTSYQLKIPTGLKSPSALRGVVVATVSEPGGRAVSAYQRITIHPYTHYPGIRRVLDGHVKINAETRFEYITLDKAGIPAPGRDLELTIYKFQWNSILRRDTRGRYKYVSEKQGIEVESYPLTSSGSIESIVFSPGEYGEYRVQLRDLASGASTSTNFTVAGWGYAPWAMDQPGRLEIDLDKATYQPGEVAKAQIKAPFSGKLILTIERDNPLSYRTVMLRENTAVIDIPVRAAYTPNVYISANLIRSTKSLERHAPARAFGVAPLGIDSEAKRLTVQLNAPEKIRPNQTVEIGFRVKGGSGARHVTIAAVDEGILQLTDFQTPDPHGFFFQQRGLNTASYDLYSAILPEIEAAKGNLSTGGGDGIEAGRKKRLSTVSVTRVKPVSLWSGLLKTDAAGEGVVRFDVPTFNGQLRLMAVAFDGDRFGSAQAFASVREPIVMTPTFPPLYLRRRSIPSSRFCL